MNALKYELEPFVESVQKNLKHLLPAAMACMHWKWRKKFYRRSIRRKLLWHSYPIVMVTKRIDIQDEILKRIGAVADRERIAAYVVGGYVRDFRLARKLKTQTSLLSAVAWSLQKKLLKILEEQISFYLKTLVQRCCR